MLTDLATRLTGLWPPDVAEAEVVDEAPEVDEVVDPVFDGAAAAVPFEDDLDAVVDLLEVMEDAAELGKLVPVMFLKKPLSPLA